MAHGSQLAVCELPVGVQIFEDSPRPTIWLSREGIMGTLLSGTLSMEGSACGCPGAEQGVVAQ